LLDVHEKYLACYLLIASVALGTVFQLFIRERLRRSKSGVSKSSFSFHIGNFGDEQEQFNDNDSDKRTPTNTPLLD